jgi:hypothetical protein
MYARSTISWGYTDAWFNRNWIEAKRVGMYRASYHVIYPDQPVDRQCANWFKANPTIDVIPRCIDLELENGCSPSQIADATWNMSNVVYAHDGIRPLIYSRYLLLNEWLDSWTNEMLEAHYYILAQYLWDRTREHPGEPTLPNRIPEKNVIMHQTADMKLGFPGESGGTKNVDYDRWEIGNTAEMHQWIDLKWNDGTLPPDPPLPGECECEQQIIELNEKVSDLANDLFATNVQVGVNDNDISDLKARVTTLEETPPPTEPEVMLVEVTDEKAVCFTYKDLNGVDKPIMDQKYEPVIRWDQGERLLVYPNRIDADGSIDWYKVATGDNGGELVPVTENGLYVKTNEVRAV